MNIPLILVASLLSIAIASGQAKLARELKTVTTGTVDVLISYDRDIDDSHEKKLKDIDGIVKGRFTNSRILHATVSGKDLLKLSEDVGVLYIAPDRMVRPTMDYAMAAIQLTSTIRSQWSGAGIGVAVIDSGIDPHLDLFRGFTSALVYQESFLPDRKSVV